MTAGRGTELRVLGVRHHGPGSARAALDALQAFGPDVLLVEGPADCDGAIPLVAHLGLCPPVALLVHRTDAPGDGVYFPFAEFSPEWQALRFAVQRGVAARFMDLPGATQLGPSRRDVDRAPDDDVELDGPAVRPGARPLVQDPLGELARVSGAGEGEDWWEEHVERSRGREDLFAAILEAMAALREGEAELDPGEARREAHMREGIRAAEREGFRRAAILCGAWHAPALVRRGADGALRVAGSARSDQALLRGLGRAKIGWTWIPWSHERLLLRSGYGAGIESPGYYQHLFHRGDRAGAAWLTRAVRLLRAADLESSSAAVIDAVRLADALAALRGRRTPGLDELREALLSTICQGVSERLTVVRERLEVGQVLGQVPADLGSLPIQRDLEREQRRLRLRPSAERRVLELDLRRALDQGRSELLHRLVLLGVGWGEVVDVASAGSFRESWSLEWRPELALALVDAHPHGGTVERAAAVKLARRARKAGLGELLELLWKGVHATLPVEPLLSLLERSAALATDARALLAALPRLFDVARWGDARGTPARGIAPLAESVLARASLALPGVAAGLDDGAARELGAALRDATGAVEPRRELPARELFLVALRSVAGSDAAHGLVRGVALRALQRMGALAEGELFGFAQRALSASLSAPKGRGPSEAARAASFLEGLVGEGGAAWTHDAGLFSVIDRWIVELDDEAFRAALPLVRRALARLSPAERRVVGERVGQAGLMRSPAATGVDAARGRRALGVVAVLLGLAPGPAGTGAAGS